MKDDPVSQNEGDASPLVLAGRDVTSVFTGEIQFRENDGPTAATSFRLEIAADWIALRYGDGKELRGRIEDDVVTFFRAKVAPSLRLPVAR